MSQPSPPPDSTSTPPLEGRQLLLARIGWVVVTVTLVALNVPAFPDLYYTYFTYTPQMLQALHQISLSPTLYSLIGILLNTVVFQIGYLVLGLLLFLRRSTDRMALFCAFTLVSFGSAVTFYDFSHGDVVPTLAANPIIHVIALALFGVGETCLVVFFYIFPSGRFAPRWTRWAALLVALFYLMVIFFPKLPSNAGGPATYVIPLSLLTAVVAQIHRYRSVSTPRERQQTKWVVLGFVLAILLIAINIPVGLLVPSSFTSNPIIANLNPVFPVALLLIPVFIVIAILRSQLWDIDTLINRALVYGSLTVLLAALYAGLIIGLEHLAGLIAGRTATNPVILVVSTLAIAALFQPLRTRMQSLIDRRFYRRKYDAEKTLAAFSNSLGQEVDLEQIREHLLAVATETMQPAHVSVWLRPQAQQPNEPAQYLDKRASW